MTKLSRWWPFGVAILEVAQLRSFKKKFLSVIDKAGALVANCSGVDRELVKVLITNLHLC